MDITTIQFVFWSIGAFIAGLAAGVGAAAMWFFRALGEHDATEGDF